MRWFMKIVGQGFVVLLPIVLTVWLFLGAGIWIERLIADPLKSLFPEGGEAYRMGMGILGVILIAFLFGLLMKFWLVRRVFGWVESRFRALPVVKTVYGAIHDVAQFLGGSKAQEKKGDMVVIVKQQNGWRQVGIVTRQNFADLPPEIRGGGTDQVAVYFPFSYQLGGFCYFVDKSLCEPVSHMSVEEVMRHSMMAWLGSGVSGTASTQKRPS